MMWTPDWSTSHQGDRKSRIEVVQGIPGYSLIAGKNTLVAFTPYPNGMQTGSNSAWLDIFQLHPWGAEYPANSHLPGTPAPVGKECNHRDKRCAEMNFIVDGNLINAPGDYWFVVTWTTQNHIQITESVVVRFYEPAKVKVLFVPIGQDMVSDPQLMEDARSIISRYIARMPFPSDAGDITGSSSEYADIFHGFIPFGEGWLIEGSMGLRDENIFGQVGDALHSVLNNYNSIAAVKAEFVIGIYKSTSPFPNPPGRANSWSNYAVCIMSAGVCTHEIEHLVGTTREGEDGAAPASTCGYFDRDVDDSMNCKDWGYDTGSSDIFQSTWNIMEDRVGQTQDAFFTRYFYEAACISYGGGCESIQQGNSVRLKTLDSNQYLHGDSETGQVSLVEPDDLETASWLVKKVKLYPHDKYVVFYSQDSCNDICPYRLLIGNESTGQIKLAPEDYFNLHPEEFMGWSDQWKFEQIAADIVTIASYYSNLSWGYDGQLNLSEPNPPHLKYWMPTFQWRVIRNMYSP